MAVQYLDLWDVLVNEVVGSPIIFILVGLIVIAYVSAAYFRIPNTGIIILCMLFVLITSMFISTQLYAIAIIMIFGFIAFWIVRIIRST